MALPVSPKNTLRMKRARRKKGGEEKRNCTLGLNLYSGSPLARSPMCPKNVAVLARVFCTKKCMAVVARRPKKVVFLCTYQCNAGGGSGGAGGGGRAWGGDLTFFKNLQPNSLPTGKSFQSNATKFPHLKLNIAVNPKAGSKKGTIKISPKETMQSFINVAASPKIVFLLQLQLCE